ncbi:MAG: putative urea ABC transporter substrate-binding protein [Pseudomonadota bacterium]
MKLKAGWILLAGLLSAGQVIAQDYKVAWSHYVGWEPWGYAQEAGIIDRWADKYGISIEVELINDYIESINLYTAGEYDACTMTNMDALTIPAVGGVDSTAVIVGDFSNGNDGIVMKNGTSVSDLRGRDVMLVELSVSHYLLARALEMNGMSERDLTVVNTSDADIASVFIANPDGAVVTWNPPLQQVRNAAGAELVFDSSKTPGEIIDLMVVRSDAPEELRLALVGAWYEVMDIMSTPGPKADEAIASMAAATGATEAEFRAQLKTTAMFYGAAEAADFAAGDQIKETMENVRQFSFDKGLFGAGADSPDFVGIAFPDGTVLGKESNVKLRFVDAAMRNAAEGQ